MLRALALAVMALYLYPAVVQALGRSSVGVVFGRYSWEAAGMILAHVLGYAAGVWAWRTRRESWLCAVVAYFGFASLAVIGSNAVQDAWGMPAALIGVRFLCGAGLVWGAFRLAASKAWLLALGTCFIAASAADAGLGIWQMTRPASEGPLGAQLRVGYDLRTAGPRDILLIGDSFVWGVGVEVSQRMGDKLEEKLRAAQKTGRVFSLGLAGENVGGYARILRRVPRGARAGRVILAYYHNDMIPAGGVQERFKAGFGALRSRTSPLLGLVSDALARGRMQDVGQYHRQLFAQYDPRERTYALRWKQLGNALDECAALSRRLSDAPPVFVILPVTEDYTEYYFAEVHARLAALANDRGFEVWDLYPAFKATLKDGTRFRTSQWDNHYDARAHEAAAEAMAAMLLRKEGKDEYSKN